MIKCLLSRPGLISGPLKSKPKLILPKIQGLTLSILSQVLNEMARKEISFQVLDLQNLFESFKPTSTKKQ